MFGIVIIVMQTIEKLEINYYKNSVDGLFRSKGQMLCTFDNRKAFIK